MSPHILNFKTLIMETLWYIVGKWLYGYVACYSFRSNAKIWNSWQPSNPGSVNPHLDILQFGWMDPLSKIISKCILPLLKGESFWISRATNRTGGQPILMKIKYVPHGVN